MFTVLRFVCPGSLQMKSIFTTSLAIYVYLFNY